MEEKQIRDEIKQVLDYYELPGFYSGHEPLVNGHINETYRLSLTDDQQVYPYILQKINNYVFREPVKVMDNIREINRHLAGRQSGQDCAIISFLDNRSGSNFTCLDGQYWRICQYVENSVAYETVENDSVLHSAGYAFGRFQELLSDMPLDRLADTIPGFHDTPARLDALFAAAAADPLGRAAEVRPELDFFARHRELAGSLMAMQRKGELPLRVTHNDTKYNNILMDKQSGRPLCVIDLDTVMPGLSMYDFGDAIRFAANRAVEDEEDLDKVGLDMGHFEAFTRGYISAGKRFLTSNELSCLTLGAIVITVELASRFLADHINGDKYFRIHRERHNLIRARSQIRLAEDMIAKIDSMNAVVSRYCRE